MDVVEAQAAGIEPEQDTTHTLGRAPNTVAAPGKQSKIALYERGEVKCSGTLTCCLEPPLVVVVCAAPRPTTMLVFEAHVSLFLPPHLINESCGDVLRA